jgi:hypothetical protein
MQSFLCISGFANHPHVRFERENKVQTLPDNGMIVCNQHVRRRASESLVSRKDSAGSPNPRFLDPWYGGPNWFVVNVPQSASARPACS